MKGNYRTSSGDRPAGVGGDFEGSSVRALVSARPQDPVGRILPNTAAREFTPWKIACATRNPGSLPLLLESCLLNNHGTPLILTEGQRCPQEIRGDSEQEGEKKSWGCVWGLCKHHWGNGILLAECSWKSVHRPKRPRIVLFSVLSAIAQEFGNNSFWGQSCFDR